MPEQAAQDPGRADRHECPCGCRTLISDRQTACPAGWHRLPDGLRDRLTAAHRDREDHRQARADAARWLAGHRGPGRG
jgi:hypothetical protein